MLREICPLENWKMLNEKVDSQLPKPIPKCSLYISGVIITKLINNSYRIAAQIGSGTSRCQFLQASWSEGVTGLDWPEALCTVWLSFDFRYQQRLIDEETVPNAEVQSKFKPESRGEMVKALGTPVVFSDSRTWGDYKTIDWHCL